ncbi:MAG: hypothetical protein GF309_14090 [Candidatus Lokiarchaeota archaeon]|nr:hypothetical protein [Candidatus Lokiarchaeota archaeon]
MMSLYVLIGICIMILMAKNIALADDVYKDFKRLKRENESFSDVIRRLMKNRGEIADLAGSATLSLDEWLEMKKLKEEQAKEDQKRAESLLSQQDE